MTTPISTEISSLPEGSDLHLHSHWRPFLCGELTPLDEQRLWLHVEVEECVPCRRFAWEYPEEIMLLLESKALAAELRAEKEQVPEFQAAQQPVSPETPHSSKLPGVWEQLRNGWRRRWQMLQSFPTLATGLVAMCCLILVLWPSKPAPLFLTKGAQSVSVGNLSLVVQRSRGSQGTVALSTSSKQSLSPGDRLSMRYTFEKASGYIYLFFMNSHGWLLLSPASHTKPNLQAPANHTWEQHEKPQILTLTEADEGWVSLILVVSPRPLLHPTPTNPGAFGPLLRGVHSAHDALYRLTPAHLNRWLQAIDPHAMVTIQRYPVRGASSVH